jgi:hypothetical protein
MSAAGNSSDPSPLGEKDRMRGDFASCSTGFRIAQHRNARFVRRTIVTAVHNRYAIPARVQAPQRSGRMMNGGYQRLAALARPTSRSSRRFSTGRAGARPALGAGPAYLPSVAVLKPVASCSSLGSAAFSGASPEFASARKVSTASFQLADLAPWPGTACGCSAAGSAL